MYDKSTYTNYSAYKKSEVQNEEVITTLTTPEQIPKPRQYARVANCLFLNARQEPTIDSKVIQVLKCHTQIQVDYRDDDWSQITLPSGHTGYVMNKFLSY